MEEGICPEVQGGIQAHRLTLRTRDDGRTGEPMRRGLKMSEKRRRRRRRRGRESCERVKTSDGVRRGSSAGKKNNTYKLHVASGVRKSLSGGILQKKKKKKDGVKNRDVGGVRVSASSLTSQTNTHWDN